MTIITLVIYSIITVLLVLLAGRKDAARDPRLTFSLLICMAFIPLMGALLPKFEILPTASTSLRESNFSWMTLISVIWISGSLIALTRLVTAAISLSKLKSRSKEIDTINGVKIFEVENLRSPVAAGIVQRVVFVPPSWSIWQKDERQIVLSHELEHHRRRDPLWRLCVELARAALWYHPLAHWMANRFTLQCEYACDEAVIRNGIEPKRYASLLCDFAESRVNSPFCIAIADTSSLEKRVQRVFKPANPAGKLSFVLLVLFGISSAFALSMIGNQLSNIDQEEIQTRLDANPFPGEP